MREAPQATATSRFSVVVVAASAGGVSALKSLVAALPSDYPVPVVIAQHRSPHRPSLLVEILQRRSKLSIEQAKHGTTLSPGNVYVAPPGIHVLVNSDDSLLLSDAERVHFVRPSADVLFESAASSYGDGVIAVVLTGMGVDGALGVRAVKRMGGTVLVQDEESSEFSGMPCAAISTGDVDQVLPLDEIPAALLFLATAGES